MKFRKVDTIIKVKEPNRIISVQRPNIFHSILDEILSERKESGLVILWHTEFYSFKTYFKSIVMCLMKRIFKYTFPEYLYLSIIQQSRRRSSKNYSNF